MGPGGSSFVRIISLDCLITGIRAVLLGGSHIYLFSNIKIGYKETYCIGNEQIPLLQTHTHTDIHIRVNQIRQTNAHRVQSTINLDVTGC